MNKKDRIKQLELENFNLKNRLKALEQRLYMLEQKIPVQGWYYPPSQEQPMYICPNVWDENVTAPTYDTQTVTND